VSARTRRTRPQWQRVSRANFFNTIGSLPSFEYFCQELRTPLAPNDRVADKPACRHPGARRQWRWLNNPATLPTLM
jgi:hypothetical protein